MKPWSSFRFRLLVGSVIWTGGLLYIAHVTSFFVMFGTAALRRNVSNLFLMLPIAIGLVVIGLLLVRNTMSSFGMLRTQLSRVHAGRERQVTGTYPTEVQPLVDDLNVLLDHRDQRVRDALAKAGDLAHGLKTPLAVLAQEAERAESAGEHEVAATIRQQVERMRRQIEYHLAHARAAASGAMPGARCSVLESVEGLARTLEQLHATKGVAITVRVAHDDAVRGQREDLDEMLGNLLDNACKWGKSQVAVASERRNGNVVITVDDDGPGLVASMREAVLRRGVRADEAAPGSGFGLAIVRDLAELHGGSIVLDASPLGGVRARLQLPAAE
jgi:signal transduction histidine kinase